MHEFILKCEERLKFKFELGYNQNVKYMNCMIDPVVCDHRLLIIYLVTETMDYVNRAYLRLNGFEYKQSGIIRYFYK